MSLEEPCMYEKNSIRRKMEGFTNGKICDGAGCRNDKQPMYFV